MFETASSTQWGIPQFTPSFVPNVFVDITDVLERKAKRLRSTRLKSALVHIRKKILIVFTTTTVTGAAWSAVTLPRRSRLRGAFGKRNRRPEYDSLNCETGD